MSDPLSSSAPPTYDALAPAGFLAAPPVTDHVEQMYRSDIEGQGYIANLTRVWAHSPEALGALSFVMSRAIELAGLDGTDRAVLTTVAAATLGDSYCSVAFGSRLARTVGDEVAAGAVGGDDEGLAPRHRALAAWARKVVEEPSATRPADLEPLRAAGFDDRQLYALTLFVAARLAFSTVNSALGAGPDPELVARAPMALRAAVDFGRPARSPVS